MLGDELHVPVLIWRDLIRIATNILYCQLQNEVGISEKPWEIASCFLLTKHQ